jgi:hypothetical protein
MTLQFAEGNLLLKEYEPGDEHAILASFNRIFGALFKGFVPRTLEYWRWQFLANPSGARLVSAFAPDGTVVAHHGFVLQRLVAGGRRHLCGQVVDTMVDPAYRRGLQRTSLSALLSNRFVGHYGGDGADRVAFFWGAPIRVAMRIGESQGSYEVVRSQLKLVLPRDAPSAVPANGVELQVVERFPDDVDALFAREAGRFGAIAVRDRAQLDWRYVQRPGGDYRIVLARRAGRLSGYAVASTGHFDGRDHQALVCDWLVERDDAAARAALLARLQQYARDAGAEQLVAVVPDSSVEWLQLQHMGFRARATHYPLVSWTCARRFDPDWLRWNWYYTLGDTDLV